VSDNVKSKYCMLYYNQTLARTLAVLTEVSYCTESLQAVWHLIKIMIISLYIL